MGIFVGGAIIKATHENPKAYYVSLFMIPFSVANKLKRIQRNFLWERERIRRNSIFKSEVVNG